MKKDDSSDITKNVMDAITTGRVRMKSRMYYVLLGLVSATAVILAGVSAAYMISIVLLWLRIETTDRMAFGARSHLSDLLSTFPWWALVVAILLSLVAVVLVRRQGRLYRYQPGVIAVILISTAFVLGLTLSAFDIGRSHVPRMNDPRGMGPGWHRER